MKPALSFMLNSSSFRATSWVLHVNSLLHSQVKRMEAEQKDCSTMVDKMLEKYSWIAAEKHLFGKSGTDYDFSSREPREAREELERLQAEQSK
jgi:structural maintenance of chromosome 2